MSGLGFNYSQGFAGNQQQLNLPIRQAISVMPRYSQNHNNMNSGPAFHGQSVGNWPMDQVQPNIPFNPQPFNLEPFNPQPFNPQSFNLEPFNLEPFNPQSFNSESFNSEPFNPQPFNSQSFNPQSFNSEPFNPQPFNPQSFNLEPFNSQPFNPQSFNSEPYNPQMTSMQNSSLQHLNLQNPSMWSPQTTNMQAIQQQSCNLPRRSPPQRKQGGRNSGPGKRSLPRPPSVIDHLIERLQEMGKLREGNLNALKYLCSQITILNNEKARWFSAEKMKRLKNKDEEARQSRRRSRETVNHLDSSPAPKRKKGAAADEKPSETSSEESGHEFTLSPAAAAAVSRPEPIQQQSSTNSFTLPPGAVFINPSAAAASPLAQQQSQQSAFTAEIAVDGSAAAQENNPENCPQNDNAAENAADFIRLTPLLEVFRGPAATGAAEEEHLPLPGPNNDLFGEEMGPNDELFGTEVYDFGEEVGAMIQETYERMQVDDEAATEESQMW